MMRTKNTVILSLLVVWSFSNTYGMNTLEVDDSFCALDTTTSSTESSPEPTPPEPPAPGYDSFTVSEENQDIIFERYFDYENQNFVYTKTIIEHEPSPFDTKLPEYQTETLEQPDISHELNFASHDDHFNDFTQDQRQQVLKEAEEQKLEEKRKEGVVSQDAYIPKDPNIIREQDFPRGKKLYLGDNRTFDSEIILNNVHTLKDLSKALSSPIIQARFARIDNDFKGKPVRYGRRGVEYNHNAELKFFDVLLSGKVAQLIDDIQHADLATAESSFNELKNLWPWKRDYTFLIPSLTEGTGESGFNRILGIDMMRIIEKGLIIRPDYMQAHTDKVSLDAIQKCKEECALLQRKNDIRALNEIKQELFHRVINNGKRANLTDSICLAIAEKAFLDPINIVLGRIKHARSPEAARQELHNLEIQVLNYAKRENLTRMPDITARLIEQYGFDLLQIAEEIYRARPDYVHAEQNQTIFSDIVQAVLNNIKHNKLSSAHMELVSVNQQITDAFKARNITDPIEQQEHLVKNFGADLRILTKSTYQDRPDFMNLIKHFTPLDVPSITIDILNNNNDYESVANEFEKVAEQVLDNAQLCDLDYIPQVENQIIQSLQIMRSPQNGAEFVFHATVADHLMTDLQHHVEDIVNGERSLVERAPELFARGITKFVTELNPVTQIKDIGSVLLGTGAFLNTTLEKVVERVIEELYDPIGTTKEYYNSALSCCEHIINGARFTCDTVSGIYYLSPQERSQRMDTYWKSSEIVCKHIKSEVTAEQIVDITAKFMADLAFGKGIVCAYRYAKEIEAISKIQQQAGRVAQALKRAVDTHLADNSILVTAEGVVLKMSDGMKGAGKTIAESTIGRRVIEKVANMKEFFELPFGNTLQQHSLKTRYRYQGQPIYQLTESISGTHLKKGHYYYLDNLHGDHIEIFDKRLRAAGVYNLDGTFNLKKFEAAEKEGRNIKAIMKG